MPGGITRIPKSLILPASGGGQAYAERTTSTSALGSAVADIPSLVFSPVPDTSQMLLVLNLPSLTKDATANWVLGWITSSDGSTTYLRCLQQISASGIGSMVGLRLLTGLTPGTALTGLKARIQTGGGTVTVGAGTDHQPFVTALRV